jgi:hypothetical protein
MMFERIYYLLCQILKTYQKKGEYSDNAVLLISLMQITNFATLFIFIKKIHFSMPIKIEKEHVIALSLVAAIAFYMINKFHLDHKKELINKKYHNLSKSQKRLWTFIALVYIILSPILMTLAGIYFDN